MNIYSIRAEQLTADQVAAWASIQRDNAALDSPYFRPEFTQTVAAVRGDVEVGVLEQNGEPVGFFPFQRSGRNVARPVGGKMSDFQGVIVRSDVAWDPRQLLRGCRLSAWHFDHLIASQQAFKPYHWNVAPSPYLDLSQGWEGYESEQLTLHRESFKRLTTKWRHATREAGPLRLEIDSADPAAFQWLVKWKTAQYGRTRMTNVLGFDWTVALLQRTLAARGEGFSGVMSVLYIADMVAAVLLSMRSFDVLHSWFSAYRPDFAPLSPGLIFWLELAKACPTIGIRRIDLGKGPEEYKTHLMSAAVDVAEGSMDLRLVAGTVRRNWHRAYRWARQSPLRRPLLAPGRALRRLVESRSFRQ
jgi:CelD/BcsL family acetyltransferase involved in cellulose biosynthesis